MKGGTYEKIKSIFFIIVLSLLIFLFFNGIFCIAQMINNDQFTTIDGTIRNTNDYFYAYIAGTIIITIYITIVALLLIKKVKFKK
jgi:hypothetical protein